MNILLWALQILLALHTATGAVWKFFNSEQAVPSLSAIPHSVWLAMGVFELAFAAALLVPVLFGSLGVLAPLAAVGIAVEMLVFCVLHLASGDPSFGPPIYWLIVAAICAFIAYGRFVLRPL